MAIAAAAGSAAYIGLFVMLGAPWPGVAVWALAVVFLGERLLGGVLSGIAQISPMWEAQQVYAGLADDARAAGCLLRDGTPNGWGAVVRLAIIAVVTLAVASWRLRHLRPDGRRRVTEPGGPKYWLAPRGPLAWGADDPLWESPGGRHVSGCRAPKVQPPRNLSGTRTTGARQLWSRTGDRRGHRRWAPPRDRATEKRQRPLDPLEHAVTDQPPRAFADRHIGPRPPTSSACSPPSAWRRSTT